MVNTGKYKILVIEDDPSQQNLMDMIFKYSIKDYKSVDQSYNLSDAIEKVENNDYDLIICDLRLPYSSCIEETVTKIIERKKESNIIFVTVEDIDSSLLDTINTNQCTFVSKNVNFLTDIQKEINRYIK